MPFSASGDIPIDNHDNTINQYEPNIQSQKRTTLISSCFLASMGVEFQDAIDVISGVDNSSNNIPLTSTNNTLTETTEEPMHDTRSESSLSRVKKQCPPLNNNLSEILFGPIKSSSIQSFVKTTDAINKVFSQIDHAAPSKNKKCHSDTGAGSSTAVKRARLLTEKKCESDKSRISEPTKKVNQSDKLDADMVTNQAVAMQCVQHTLSVLKNDDKNKKEIVADFFHKALQITDSDAVNIAMARTQSVAEKIMSTWGKTGDANISCDKVEENALLVSKSIQQAVVTTGNTRALLPKVEESTALEKKELSWRYFQVVQMVESWRKKGLSSAEGGGKADQKRVDTLDEVLQDQVKRADLFTLDTDSMAFYLFELAKLSLSLSH